jgi:predicted metal-dependent hydrolase
MTAPLYPVQDFKCRVLRSARLLHVNPRVIRLQRMTKKWGSCSTSGIVTFAEDIVDQDETFQNFVIVHELLHLRIPSHGRLFKALMSAHAPGWQKMDKERMIGRSISVPTK